MPIPGETFAGSMGLPAKQKSVRFVLVKRVASRDDNHRISP
jgi:hypothetical protein